MREILQALFVFVLLCASASAGFTVRSRLPEEHKSKESTALVQIVASLQVTFAALVLGLVLTNSLSGLNTAGRDRSSYAAALTQLDQCFRNYGDEFDEARGQLRSYVAAVIASTWPSEDPPHEVTYPDISAMPLTGEVSSLAGLFNNIGLAIISKNPSDRHQQALLERCTAAFSEAMERRWDVINDARTTVSEPFFYMLVAWLTLAFGCLGIMARSNKTVMIVIVLCSISVSSAMFVISDMQQPYGGFYGVSSRSMREAFLDISKPVSPSAVGDDTLGAPKGMQP